MPRFVIDFSCCGCCSIKTGAKIVGWYLLIQSILFSLLYTMFAVFHDKIVEKYPDCLEMSWSVINGTLGELLIWIFVDVCYLFGVYTNRKTLYIPIIFWCCVVVIGGLILLGAFITKLLWDFIVLTILFRAIILYCLLIIWSDYMS